MAWCQPGTKPLYEPMLCYLLIGPFGTNFSQILFAIQIFSFKKMHWKMLAILSWPQCVNSEGATK